MQIIKQDPSRCNADLSYIKSREIYVDAPAAEYQVYDVVSGHIIQCNQIWHHLTPFIRSLMTSTTAFGMNSFGIVIYSRSLIWRYYRNNKDLESYRPIVDDISRPVHVRVYHFAAAMHQNGNVCYVRTFPPLGESKVYKLELPADGYIVDVYFNHTHLNVLFKQDEVAFFGRLNMLHGKTARLNGDFYEFPGEVNLSMITLPGQAYRMLDANDEPHVNWTFKWTLHRD